MPDHAQPIASQNLGKQPSEESPMPCRIVDVELPFFSMVALLVKLAIAAIPALIILVLLAVFLSGLFYATYLPRPF